MLPKPFLEFIELLAENDVRFLVVGGYAVAAHGYPRYTGDIEIAGKVVPFLSYQDLITNKSSTTRGKDRVDVEELQKRRAGS